MRPSIDWNPGLPASDSAQCGTDGHTAGPGSAREIDPVPASLGADEQQFFADGEQGRYEGGPATLEEDLELEEQPVTVNARTPEQDARRARFARGVAFAVGAAVAFFAIGLVRQHARGPAIEAASAALARSAPAAAPLARVEVSPAQNAEPVPAPIAVAQEQPSDSPAPAPAPQPATEPAAAPAPALAKAPSVVRAPAVVSEPSERAAAATPTRITTVTASVTPVRAPAGPNVANFAARTPPTANVAPRPATASFAPAQ